MSTEVFKIKYMREYDQAADVNIIQTMRLCNSTRLGDGYAVKTPSFRTSTMSSMKSTVKFLTGCRIYDRTVLTIFARLQVSQTTLDAVRAVLKSPILIRSTFKAQIYTI